MATSCGSQPRRSAPAAHWARTGIVFTGLLGLLGGCKFTTSQAMLFGLSRRAATPQRLLAMQTAHGARGSAREKALTIRKAGIRTRDVLSGRVSASEVMAALLTYALLLTRRAAGVVLFIFVYSALLQYGVTSPVPGMALVFVSLLVLDFGIGKSEQVFVALEPGYRCTLLEATFSAGVWARLLAFLVLGYLVTFVCTAGVASIFPPPAEQAAERPVVGVRELLLGTSSDGQPVSQKLPAVPRPRPPYRRYICGILLALTLQGVTSLHVAAESLFMVCVSLLGFTTGQRLPPTLQKYAHPLLLCAAATLGGAAAWAALAGPDVGMLSVVATYTSWPGGGAEADLLPPTLVALGLLLFEFRAVLWRDLAPIVVTALVSAAVTVFSTPLLAHWLRLPRPLAIAAISRAVASPFAVDVASSLGANSALAVAMTTFSGLLGVISGQAVFAVLRLRSQRARGLSISGAAQGIGAISLAGREQQAFTYGLVGFIMTGSATVLLCLATTTSLHQPPLGFGHARSSESSQAAPSRGPREMKRGCPGAPEAAEAEEARPPPPARKAPRPGASEGEEAAAAAGGGGAPEEGVGPLRARARALRSLLLPDRVRRPPQLAAAVVGGDPPRRALTLAELRVSRPSPRGWGPAPHGAQEREAWGLPRRGGLAQPEAPGALAARLAAVELRQGALLVARTGADPKNAEAHCEALLLGRLAAEGPEALGALRSVLLIADFAAARPGLQLAVAYERHFIPAEAARFREGVSDASSVSAMERAGVVVFQLDKPGCCDFEEATCRRACLGGLLPLVEPVGLYFSVHEPGAPNASPLLSPGGLQDTEPYADGVPRRMAPEFRQGGLGNQFGRGDAEKRVVGPTPSRETVGIDQFYLSATAELPEWEPAAVRRAEAVEDERSSVVLCRLAGSDARSSVTVRLQPTTNTRSLVFDDDVAGVETRAQCHGAAPQAHKPARLRAEAGLAALLRAACWCACAAAACWCALAQAAGRRRGREGAAAAADAEEGTAELAAPMAGLAASAAPAGARRAEEDRPRPRATPLLEMLAGPRGSRFGYRELAGIAAVCVADALVMSRKAAVLGGLFASQGGSRELSARWRWCAWQFSLLAALHSLLADAAGYVQARLALNWRRNVTRKLHDLYFARMSFYKIQHKSRELSVVDAHLRICRDGRDMVGAAVGICTSLTEALVKTAIFGAVALTQQHWTQALAAPCCFLLAAKAVRRMEPAAGARAHAALEHAEGKLRQLLARVQQHAGSICMLQGEAFELDMLGRAVRDVAAAARQRRDVMLRVEAAEWTLFGWPQAASVLELAAFFCAACAGGAAAAPHDGGLGAPDHALRLGVAMRDVHGFFNLCAGWGAFLGVRTQLLAYGHAAHRVKQLCARLERLQASGAAGHSRRTRGSKEKDRRQQQRQEWSPQEADATTLVFEDVAIANPRRHGELLLRRLSFSVAEGQHLLVCGPQGAGKTALARYLFGLWPAQAGRVTGLQLALEGVPMPAEVCVLPQDPVCTAGSLSDQLTYPSRARAGAVPRHELQRWLRYVGLEHLVDIEESCVHGPVGQVDWAALLSRAEQQALAFARLLRECPRFAVLDECTSALSRAAERHLVQLVQEAGITCVTLSRRPLLEDLHANLLELTGDLERDSQGWRPLRPARALPAASQPKPRCRSPGQLHARLQEHLDSRAAGCPPLAAGAAEPPAPGSGPRCASVASHQAEVRARWPSRFARLRAVMRLGLQTPSRRRSALRRACAAAALLLARALAHWLFSRSLGGIVRAALVRQRAAAAAELLCGSLVACAGGLADQLARRQACLLSSELWAGAASHLQRRLMRDAAALLLGAPRPGGASVVLDDPAVRVAEARALFESLGAQACEALIPLSVAALSMPVAVRGLGGAPLLLVAGHSLLSGLLRRLLPDQEPSQDAEAALESRFAAIHSRVWGSAESIAFSRGGVVECHLAETALDDLLESACAASWRELAPRAAARFVLDHGQLPAVSRQALVRGLLWGAAGASAPSVDSLCAGFLLDRLVQSLQVGAQHLARWAERLRRLDAQCLRVLELALACDASSGRGARAASPAGSGAAAAQPGPSLRVRGLSLTAPGGAELARGLRFDLEAGAPLVVTGPSGSGKSLLGRALLGLWQASPGTRGAPAPAPTMLAAPRLRPLPQSLAAVPQCCYLPAAGRLVAQLAYPCVLGLPSRPPFEVHVRALPPGITDALLLEHFQSLGASGSRVLDAGECAGAPVGVVTFRTLSEVLRAVARPHDRVIGDHELECEIGGGDGCGLSTCWQADAGLAPPTPSVPAPPPAPSGQVPELARMRRCLRAVGLEHVLLRERDGWFATARWEEALSAPEQQRLCLARCMYHGPTFALLDDCLSRLPPGEEQKLVAQLLEEWDIWK
ncbi:unnamed protein product, partial [Prorocentrum cordatum]